MDDVDDVDWGRGKRDGCMYSVYEMWWL